NTSWTGIRLLVGVLTSGLGAFIFAFFYLRSLNSHGLWYPSGSIATKPSVGVGTTIMVLIVVSALVQTAGLQQIKAGKRGTWQLAALIALVLGVVAAAVQIWQLASLSFTPGARGFASLFGGAS